MGRICDRCTGDIKLKYLLKQDSLENIICPNCGRLLGVTKMSKVVTLASYLCISSIVIILPIKINYKIMIIGLWSIFSYYLLKPLIYNYKELEK